LSKDLNLYLWWPSRLKFESDRQQGLATRVYYELVAANGRVLHSQELPLTELPSKVAATVFVHADDISLMAFELPKIKGKKAQDALSFVAEPAVLGNIEDIWVSAHHALPSDASGIEKHVLSCVEKLKAKNILETLSDLGIPVKQLCCEALHFEVRSRELWLMEQGDTTWVCSRTSPPWSMQETDVAQRVLRLRWWAQQNALSLDEGLLLISKNQSAGRLWEQASGVPVECLGRDALALRADANPVVPQREIRRAGKGLVRDAGPWTLTMRLAAGVALCGLGLLNLFAWQINRQASQLDGMVSSAFEDALPNTPQVADPILMLERAKQELSQNRKSAGSAYTQLLHATASAMPMLPFNGLSSVAYDNQGLQMIFATEVSEAQRQEIDNNLRAQQIKSSWQTDDKKRAKLMTAWTKPRGEQ
jgi:type II secretory pathway component PulL